MIKVISAEPIENHKIKVSLSNGRRGVFDVSPYLDKGIFQELKDQAYFRQIKVAFGGVVWPHEQDFSPETIEMEMRENPAARPGSGPAA